MADLTVDISQLIIYYYLFSLCLFISLNLNFCLEWIAWNFPSNLLRDVFDYS